jgi:murein DD-endopeptidase MepM/ murein hydrolase activator NlpD
MRKGKTTSRKRYLSVMIVPHSTGRVKTLRLSASYSRLGLAGAATLALLIAAIAFTYTTFERNHDLEATRKALAGTNANQAREIARLKKDAVTFNIAFRDLSEKYDLIAEDYISSGGGAVRSGSGGAGSVVSGGHDLKRVLNDLEKVGASSGVDETGTKHAEAKLTSYLAAIPTRWPTLGTVSSEFGFRSDPFYGSTAHHDGIDISAAYGQGIYAAGGGTVAFAGQMSGYGNAVIISHGYGITTLYGHASKLLVVKGQRVRRGELIARVGSTGRSTGNHLHFEIRINGIAIAPLAYLGSR